jgi:lipopolysaccharide transport system ATP-binding protein
MREVVIKVENLSKQYRLGMVGAGTLREDLVGLWHRFQGKEDPYIKLAETNDRSSAGTSDYVWALRDVNFEVKQGEVLGIIGKNGAGKSTLLKLLSRVTAPTTGSIKVKGRIASLLEVGTGFHPELTGKENIFLNGAIMGMRKAEISSKLDEIIEFAGVQRYVDTPVKRYSSGMYVRLAFAVAAHLEPEILIVDEVLAVGDAEFQKKAIGKMQDVSTGQGRTVLFVSHNMKAVKTLCTRALLMDKGQVHLEGDTTTVIERYFEKSGLDSLRHAISGIDIPQIDAITIVSGKIANSLPISTGDAVEMEFVLQCHSQMEFHFNIHLCSYEKDVLFVSSTESIEGKPDNTYVAKFRIPTPMLNEREYRVKISLVKDRSKTIHKVEDVFLFNVIETETSLNWYGKTPGLLRPKILTSLELL